MTRQNNWLISQFINKTEDQRDVFIKVVYSINADCLGGCLTTLDMRVLQTNELNLRNTSFFTRITEALTDNVRDGTTLTTSITRVSPDSSTSGLYVAFQDQGTCIGLSEVTVFYPICDAISLEAGANFTATHPGETSNGICFSNMAINLPPSFEATCTLTFHSESALSTRWTIDGRPLQCMCVPGYVYRSSSSEVQCEGMCIVCVLLECFEKIPA